MLVSILSWKISHLSQDLCSPQSYSDHFCKSSKFQNYIVVLRLSTAAITWSYFWPVLVPYLNHQFHVALCQSWVLVRWYIAGTVEKKLRHGLTKTTTTTQQMITNCSKWTHDSFSKNSAILILHCYSNVFFTIIPSNLNDYHSDTLAQASTLIYTNNNKHHLMALCLGLSKWAGTRRNIQPHVGHSLGDICHLLAFMVKGEDNRGRCTDNLATLHPIQSTGVPSPSSPPFLCQMQTRWSHIFRRGMCPSTFESGRSRGGTGFLEQLQSKSWCSSCISI